MLFSNQLLEKAIGQRHSLSLIISHPNNVQVRRLTSAKDSAFREAICRARTHMQPLLLKYTCLIKERRGIYIPERERGRERSGFYGVTHWVVFDFR